MGGSESHFRINFVDQSYPPLDCQPNNQTLKHTIKKLRRFHGDSWEDDQTTYWETPTTLKQRIHEYTKVPIDQIRLFTSRTGFETYNCNFQFTYKYGGRTIWVDWATTAAYQAKPTKLALSTKQKMIAHLNQFTNRTELVDLTSINEMEAIAQIPQVKEVQAQVRICNLTDQNQVITFKGEELVPVRVLPENGGVVCGGRFIGQFRGASQELVTAVDEYHANLAHTKKLLHELPIALANNKIALDTHVRSDDPNYDEIGPLAIERCRIEYEIEAQQKKLKLLEDNPIKIDPTKFVPHTYQTAVKLPFGLSQLDGKRYVIEAFHLGPVVH